MSNMCLHIAAWHEAWEPSNNRLYNARPSWPANQIIIGWRKQLEAMPIGGARGQAGDSYREKQARGGVRVKLCWRND